MGALLLAALTAAAPAPTVIDAERAFAAAAQRDGQWTAFRATAAPDAVMFAPQMVNAQAWLKGRADPKEAIVWWPISALVSCDGTLAVSVGGWTNNGGKAHGTFTTVWKRTPESWRWVLDQGHDTPEVMPRPEVPDLRRASCRAVSAVRSARQMQIANDDVIQLDNAMPGATAEDLQTRVAKLIAGPDFDQPQKEGRSIDGTLKWSVRGNDQAGWHGLTVFRWSGFMLEIVRQELSAR